MNKNKHPVTWKIDVRSLDGYKKPTWDEEWFQEIPETKYAICFYNIVEEGMLKYYSSFAIFENKENPILIINSVDVRIWHNFSHPYFFIPKRNLFVLVFTYYDKKSDRTDYPFLVINPEKKEFAFIRFDFTSIYYKVETSEFENHLKLTPNYIKDLERYVPTNSIKPLHIKLLNWHALKKLDSLYELYCKKHFIQ